MEQQLVAWMLSGGDRVETRDQRLQRMHRYGLQSSPSASPARDWIASITAALGRREPRDADLAAICCPA
ncbi:MAG: hypothetical protein WEC14_04250 [Chloroflexota bacterium]